MRRPFATNSLQKCLSLKHTPERGLPEQKMTEVSRLTEWKVTDVSLKQRFRNGQSSGKVARQVETWPVKFPVCQPVVGPGILLADLLVSLSFFFPS